VGKQQAKNLFRFPKAFFYSLVHKHLNEDHYSLRPGSLRAGSISNARTGERILPEDLDLTCDSDSTIYELNFNALLEIRRQCLVTLGKLLFYNSSSIDEYGNLLTPFNNVRICGIWANQAIADFLPLDYVYNEK
jgi:hypothetical protein